MVEGVDQGKVSTSENLPQSLVAHNFCIQENSSTSLKLVSVRNQRA